jgi:GTP cyclohydrolase II/3,4-dihydroxy 2-butanone 4-phosphate synthase/GTP cyclohydrolase II
VHSACASSELFHATNCECREELEESMKRIRKEGKGVLIYLDQEGAGNGLEAKVAAYGRAFAWKGGRVVAVKDPKTGEDLNVYAEYKKMGYGKESRSFKAAADMLKEMGIRSVRLLTNNPSKVKGLVDEGIRAVPVGLHIKPKNEIVAGNLKAKAKELGHRISKRHWTVSGSARSR